MVTYTGTDANGAETGTATTGTVSRSGPAVEVSETGGWSGPSARSGFSAGTSDSETQTLSSRSKWDVEAEEAETVEFFGRTVRTGGWSGPSERAGVSTEATESGGLIPLEYFRIVTGAVLDEEGEPIEDATHVLAFGAFSTIGTVTDGRYSIFLLRQEYGDFAVLAEAPSGRPYDFVRYELEEANPAVGTDATDVDLKFDTTTPSPFYFSTGVTRGLGRD